MIKLLSDKKYILVSAILYFASMILVAIDKSYEYKWLAFILWILSMLIPFFFFIKTHNESEALIRDKLSKNELIFLIILGICAIGTRFIFLSNYPFNSIGDELRDGGMDAMQISNGVRENIFAYGRYDAHGLNVPIFVVPFYKILGNSTLAFKVPAAIISIIDIFLVYFLCKNFINKKVGAFAAFILLSLPIHLYYARSEVVVIFTSLLTTALLFVLFQWITRKDSKSIGLLGLVIGFSFGFHASLRTFLFITIAIVPLICIYNTIKLKYKTINLIKKILLFTFMIIAGFGPRLLFTTPEILLHTKRLPSIEQSSQLETSTTSSQKIISLVKTGIKNYPKSFMVYIKEPTSSHFHSHKPILNIIFGIFFLIGLIVGLLGKNRYIRILCIYALVIPFTNSAITDIINADHRLASLLPISAILSSYGVYRLMDLFKNRWSLNKFLNIAILISVSISVINNVLYFFNSQEGSYSMARSDDSTIYQDFLVMHSINVIKSSAFLSDSPIICITTSTFDYTFFNYAHIQEHFYFLLPNKHVQIQADPNNYNRKEVHISATCPINIGDYDWKEYNYCVTPQKFVCPPDKSSFKIYRQTLQEI